MTSPDARMMTSALDATEAALTRDTGSHSIKVQHWYDSFHPAYARNLSRILIGKTIEVGDDEQGIREETVTISSLGEVTVGIDTAGIFCGINVRDLDGREWTLYQDGTITDSDDRQVGTHSFTTKPQVVS